jgi:putative ABC transport system permease protein
MNLIKLAYTNVKHRPLTTGLNVLLVATGIGIITLLGLIKKQVESQFENNIKGVDMVLGASGSPLQLILSAVYHIDAPTGNISYKEAKRWMQHPFIEKAIPLAYGDNYLGYPIVGTDVDAYLNHFDIGLAQGTRQTGQMQAWVGHSIAQNLKLKPGDVFESTHGLHSEGEVHDHEPYTIAGILQKTGGVADKLIFTSIKSVWHIHAHEEDVPHEHDEDCEHDHDEALHQHEHDEYCQHELDEAKQEITAVLMKYKNPLAVMQLPRQVKSESNNMQIALPAIELNRLFSLLGVGLSALQALAIIIMLLSAVSIFISLLNTLKERRYELAIMRSMGASKIKVFGLMLAESLILAIVGYLSGMLLGTVAYGFMAIEAQSAYRMNFDVLTIDWAQQIMLLSATLLMGIFAALIPAYKAYALQISETLTND